ncbi:MAG: exosortase/archaeosortase family protein [bacterium]
MLYAVSTIIAAMYAPVLYKLFHLKLYLEEYSHGPLIFLVFFWLIWREKEVAESPVDDNLHVPALMILLFGLLLYWIGVKHHAIVVSTASMPFIIIGAYAFLLGKPAGKWIFPASYLIFTVPLPNFLVDMITFPLKRFVSLSATSILKVLHYPVIRKGVLLTIGDYKLLVADACSGMRSIISLLALISLYVYLQKARLSRSAIVLLSIIPIAVVANTIRVTILALITYHLGEAAGQSYYHDLSGFLVFFIALACIITVDKLSKSLLEFKGGKI